MAAATTHPIAQLASLGFPSEDTNSLALLSTPGLELTYNARGALLAAFSEIARSGRRKVLLPAFHCPSAITPAIMAGLDPVYYRIGPDLCIDNEDVLALADTDTAAILIIHFFGLSPNLKGLRPLENLNIKIIEDCSHSYVAADTLELAGSASSDFRIFSFWKIAPSGVGGGIWRREPSESKLRLSPPLMSSLRNYKLLLEESLQHADAPVLRSLLRGMDALRQKVASAPVNQTPADQPTILCGENYYPVSVRLANSRMPAHVRRIIGSTDLSAVVRRRRANFDTYKRFARRLPRLKPLMLDLPTATCPWVYPVLIEDRSSWDSKMRAAGVALHTFGIYLHSTLFASENTRAIHDARFLAERMLCLSIHQDLTVMDIEGSSRIIEETFNSAAELR